MADILPCGQGYLFLGKQGHRIGANAHHPGMKSGFLSPETCAAMSEGADEPDIGLEGTNIVNFPITIGCPFE